MQAIQDEKVYHCLIALGGNLGDPLETFPKAIQSLRQSGIYTDLISRMYETEPVDCGEQPMFINAALVAHTALEPAVVLEKMLEVEAALGRVRDPGFPHGPRTLDLDLLLVDNIELHTPSLKLPHPEMHRRAFVLIPACDIAADWVHPIARRTLAELLAKLPEAQAAAVRCIPTSAVRGNNI